MSLPDYLSDKALQAMIDESDETRMEALRDSTWKYADYAGSHAGACLMCTAINLAILVVQIVLLFR